MISCRVAFLKSKDPDGCVSPMCIITPPGLIHFIACCLVISNPTVSKIMSKLLSVIILLSGLAVSASKYFAHSLNLFLLRSVITMSLQFLTFDKINPQSKPIAPVPVSYTHLTLPTNREV